VGAASGALTTKIADFGIDDAFAREVGERLQPGGVALVLLVRSANADRVVAEISSFGGTLLRTSLSPEAEAWLREELSAGADPQDAAVHTGVSLADQVRCADGDGGSISRVIVNPRTRKLSHLVVREPGRHGVERIVPFEFIEKHGGGTVQLHLTRAQLADLPSYEVSADIVTTAGLNTQARVQSLGYQSDVVPQHVRVTQTNVPDGAIVARRGDRVEATDRRIGSVDDLIVGEDGTIVGLVLRQGHLWGAREVIIPITEIDHVDKSVVYLKLSKAQIDAR
jgi:hypothetical protein